MNDEVKSEILSAPGPVPKLTPADIEAVIASENYFTAEHGVEGAMARGELHARHPSSVGDRPLALVTFCVLLLRNGAKVVGINHGPVSPERFGAEEGRKDARAKAIEKVWELEGYALRERLAGNAAMAWQPIETAPRDGTVILLAESYCRDTRKPYIESGHPRIADPATWDGGRPYDRGSAIACHWRPDLGDSGPAGWYNTGSWQRMLTFDPDIWMPIEIPGQVEGWPE